MIRAVGTRVGTAVPQQPAQRIGAAAAEAELVGGVEEDHAAMLDNRPGASAAAESGASSEGTRQRIKKALVSRLTRWVAQPAVRCAITRLRPKRPDLLMPSPRHCRYAIGQPRGARGVDGEFVGIGPSPPAAAGSSRRRPAPPRPPSPAGSSSAARRDDHIRQQQSESRARERGIGSMVSATAKGSPIGRVGRRGGQAWSGPRGERGAPSSCRNSPADGVGRPHGGEVVGRGGQRCRRRACSRP